MNLQYKKDKAIVFEYYPGNGVATVAKSTGYDSTNTELWAEASATIDDYSGAVSASAIGSRSVTVDDSTGTTVGRKYWIATTGGRGSQNKLIDKSGNDLTFQDPMEFTVDTVQGLLVSYDKTAITTTYRNARIDWQLTINGVVEYKSFLFDNVTWPFELDITEEKIENVEPNFGETAGKFNWSKHVTAAENEIWKYLQSKQIHPDLVRSRDILETAACTFILYKLNFKNEDMREAWYQLYRDYLQAFADSRAWYDEEDDLVDSGSEYVPPKYVKFS